MASMEKVMINATIKGEVSINQYRDDVLVDDRQFTNTITDYGLEYFADLIQPASNIVQELVISDHSGPINVTDLNPNYDRHFYRSNQVIVSFSKSGEIKRGTTTNDSASVSINLEFILKIHGEGHSINDRTELFDISEISLLSAHPTNVWEDSYCAVIGRTKIKNSATKPIPLKVRLGDVIRVKYVLRFKYTVLGIGVNDLPFMITLQGADEQNISHVSNKTGHYETPTMYCKRVKSNTPGESICNFQLKRDNAFTPGEFNNFNLPMGMAVVTIHARSQYTTDIPYLLKDFNKRHVKITYSRYDMGQQMTPQEIYDQVKITKINNTTYNVVAPPNVNVTYYKDDGYPEFASGILNNSQNSISGVRTFPDYSLTMAYFSFYASHNNGEQVYISTLKGRDYVAPEIENGRWIDPTHYEFYIEDDTTITPTYFGGWENLTITSNDLNTGTTNAAERDIHGPDINLWKTMELKPILVKSTENSVEHPTLPGRIRYVLTVPFVFDDYNYMTIYMNDEYGNNRRSGKIFNSRTTDEHPDNVMEYGKHYGQSYSWSSNSTKVEYVGLGVTLGELNIGN